ncbi:E3 ubiquitin-protein ligase At1g63170 [Dendrobium catenatum]|uniref:E3 ubiquitin-protein ligase n=1 Tax=Dendrobium catenatum TaxID=906689 RepID=A0A2I0VRE7_9ASPA|nr:E3 ubiquitin-protein ligase At1g63170 [Dendrobium catenatum]XP_020699682.1 E3 ubiquitin-protein ligase At1g63170 [Dendrobium catenatum]XP_020699683.1 E3 ubiquitin-protein ligase At1g63170 [Dendrobium catenatum]XP_028556126.1 E3 ubiquitin-protein ligase At1g63170 [Dendrobium catenatum]XP_028556127.1 E3 ubiquitin-protein ligase At1g63170 [Dendrobium catenatum]XP_028556128.1 E3 ubiquitin-protein ligase At1g63170 [Dendrobium catenatum]PKU65992.1 E3 ubiquitin-protein ligase [Dendrobium catenatu
MAAGSSLEEQCESQTDRYPLLMERPVNDNADEHVIDVVRGSASSTSVVHGNGHNEDRSSTSTNAFAPQSSTSQTASNSRNASFNRGIDNYGRRNRSPLNSGLWISIELIVNLSQIIAAVVVLSFSRHENPQTPLFAWVIGYTVGCVATLPHLYWRYINRNRLATEQDATNSFRNISQNNAPESNSYTAISVAHAVEAESGHGSGGALQLRRNTIRAAQRLNLNALVDHLKMALDCFFAVWFVVGNVWLFGGRTSASDAPNLYRLCIVFLTFSCIGYAMPFILCAMICCCLPCIISIMGLREEMILTRGASTESINALPTYKFKAKRIQSADEGDIDSDGEGGIVAAGTDKERIISAEDAVCCICLTKYVDNDDLRELPCGHFFHTECVDKWLKINALCPLCKKEVGNTTSSSSANPSRDHIESRMANHADQRQESQ